MRERFQRIANTTTALAGSPISLALAGALILLWLASGPIFRFSDTWQLMINTTTTIITFLMVFVIQATTNRESKALQLKVDELIRAVTGARNELIAAEFSSDDRIAQLQSDLLEAAEVDVENAVAASKATNGRKRLSKAVAAGTRKQRTSVARSATRTTRARRSSRGTTD